MRPVSLAVVFVLAGCRSVSPGPAPPPSLPPARPPDAAPPVAAPEPEAAIEKDDEAFAPVAPGVFERRSYYPQTEVTEWTLAGGARLVFRPLRSPERRVALYAFAPGGFAAVPDSLGGAAYAAAVLAGGVREGGVAVDPGIRAQEAVVSGSADTGDLGALFALVRTALLAPAAAGPGGIDEALEAALAGHPLPARAGGDVRAVFDGLFGDPRRFTFVVVGDATAALVEQEAARALPRMRPSRQALLSPVEPGPSPVRLPAGAERHRLPAADEDAVAVAFRGRLEPGYDALAALDVVAALLADAVGGGARAAALVYFDGGVGEVRLVAEDPDGGAAGFEADVLDAVRALRAGPPSDRALGAARGRLRDAHARSLDEVDGWLEWLPRLSRYDHDTREALRYGRRLSGVTADRVHRAARAVLDPARFVLVARPED